MRFRMLVGSLVLLALLTTGCSELLSSDVRPVERGQTSLRPLLDPDSLAIPGTDTTDVTDLLGEPTRSQQREPPDGQRPGTVTVLTYDGLEVVVRELRKPQRAFISDLVITSRSYVTWLPVGVGTPRGDLEAVLGEPSESEGSDATYPLTDDGDRCIVTYENDQAARLVFQFS